MTDHHSACTVGDIDAKLITCGGACVSEAAGAAFDDKRAVGGDEVGAARTCVKRSLGDILDRCHGHAGRSVGVCAVVGLVGAAAGVNDQGLAGGRLNGVARTVHNEGLQCVGAISQRAGRVI